MKRERCAIGRRGEETAMEFLVQKGFQIIERNFRTRFGEIDLVASENNELVFIEVRSRSSTKAGHPLETVNHRKQRQVMQMARAYLMVKHLSTSQLCRFDVVGIVWKKDKPPEIIHIRNAFCG